MFKIISVFLLCCGAALSSMAADQPLEAFVDSNSQKILAQINAGRAEFDKDPSVLYGEMGAALDTLVDFETLTKGVMGKYHKSATQEQIQGFQQTLRAYIVEIYTKALVKFKSKTIEILPLKKKPTSTASITMRVTTQDNKTFNLAYSMAKKASQWQVRNMIVDGINMGLTYRSQFDSMMISNGNDIDLVIATWGDSAEDESIDK